MLSLIAAIDKNGLIGNNGQLPWSIPVDLKYFKKTTTGHTVIMGRKTYQSIGRALPNRHNIILTRDRNLQAEECLVINNVHDLFSKISSDEEVFVIGGKEIYEQLIDKADKLYLTRIHKEYLGNTYFPSFDMNDWSLSSTKIIGEDPLVVTEVYSRNLE